MIAAGVALITALGTVLIITLADNDDDAPTTQASDDADSENNVIVPTEPEPTEPTKPEPTKPEPTEPEPTEPPEDPPVAEPESERDEMSVGEGTTINMARANWSTGYFQAQVYKQLLEELGYTVSGPSEFELGPSLAYLAMAQGDFDFWVNSWYPYHVSW